MKRTLLISIHNKLLVAQGDSALQFDKDLESAHKGLFLSVRSTVLDFSGVDEVKKDKITTYSYGGSALCHLRTMPHGVDIGFLKGAFINDTLGKLHGKTKRMRVLSLASHLEDELKFYMKAAIELNT